MVLFTQDVKKIKGAAHKNCDVNVKCSKPTLNERIGLESLLKSRRRDWQNTMLV